MGDIFSFKHFDVANRRSAMRVGTDGVLLGAWAMPALEVSAETPLRCLDVGCGTGVISLMIAQRFENATITAIDIDADAVAESTENFAASPFASRLNAKMCDFVTYNSAEQYDLIVSNPPFFTETLLSPDAQRAVARHANSLPLSALIGNAAKLLSDNGIIALIVPHSRDEEVIAEVALAHLSPIRRCALYTKPGKPQRRTLWAIGNRQHNSLIEETLFIHDTTGGYSEPYKKLLADFYLNF